MANISTKDVVALIERAALFSLKVSIESGQGRNAQWQFLQPSGEKSPTLHGAREATIWLDGFELGKNSRRVT